MRGRAVMAARYDVLVGDVLVASHRFGSELPLRSAGYPALVDAQRALAKELAAAISRSVAEAASP